MPRDKILQAKPRKRELARDVFPPSRTRVDPPPEVEPAPDRPFANPGQRSERRDPALGAARPQHAHHGHLEGEVRAPPGEPHGIRPDTAPATLLRTAEAVERVPALWCAQGARMPLAQIPGGMEGCTARRAALPAGLGGQIEVHFDEKLKKACVEQPVGSSGRGTTPYLYRWGAETRTQISRSSLLQQAPGEPPLLSAPTSHASCRCESSDRHGIRLWIQGIAVSQSDTAHRVRRFFELSSCRLIKSAPR